jgi:hypothetical protein
MDAVRNCADDLKNARLADASQLPDLDNDSACLQASQNDACPFAATAT